MPAQRRECAAECFCPEISSVSLSGRHFLLGEARRWCALLPPRRLAFAQSSVLRNPGTPFHPAQSWCPPRARDVSLTNIPPGFFLIYLIFFNNSLTPRRNSSFCRWLGLLSPQSAEQFLDSHFLSPLWTSQNVSLDRKSDFSSAGPSPGLR